MYSYDSTGFLEYYKHLTVLISESTELWVEYLYDGDALRLADSWYMKLHESTEPAAVESSAWEPKNPQLLRLFEESRERQKLKQEKLGPDTNKVALEEAEPEFWQKEELPAFSAPNQIETHVKTNVWRELTVELEAARAPGWERKSQLAKEVLFQLENGVDSGVSGPGLLPICVENCFIKPEMDIPRMFDALMSAVKEGTMAGPLEKTEALCRRINGFLSVPKPGGHTRQVGDLSRPMIGIIDRSFNGNVDPSLRKCWPLEQLTARQFSFMLISMGKGSVMGKSDLSQAYKCMPVSKEQRQLQRFMFAGKVFEDLRLVFGDTYAPMMFDRFHHVILTAFVSTVTSLPSCIWGKCIDDIPVVVPEERVVWLQEYFRAYRNICDRLGVKISPIDNSEKSFESSQLGEVLGIVFDTKRMMWWLPEKKRIKLVVLIRSLIFKKDALTTKQWEIITGKLNNLCEMWPPGKWFMDSFYKRMEYSKKWGKSHPRAAKRDAKVWLSVLEARELPVLPRRVCPRPDHILSYSDASGEFLDTPGIGILIPAQYGEKPRVAAWSFPIGFLDCIDEKGAKACNKTTCLEAVGMLSGILLAPDLLQGKSVIHIMDNQAACLAWDRARSLNDSWATTILRATAHVCAALRIDLFTRWQERRSDRCTIVVDNLSHDRCEELNKEELTAYLHEKQCGFPEPLLAWMRKPRVDVNLGIELVNWLKLNCLSVN